MSIYIYRLVRMEINVIMHAGTEALFADVGHFTVRSIQISMCSVTYPALVFAYTGQAAFLRKNMKHVSDAFFESIPGKRFFVYSHNLGSWFYKVRFKNTIFKTQLNVW